MADADSLTPVPMASIIFEVLRSGALLVLLIGAGLAFAAVHAWVIAGILLLVAVASMVSGAVVHPTQLRRALRPPVVCEVRATPLFRRKQAWLQFHDRTDRDLAVEIRSRRMARQLGQDMLHVLVAGPVEPGQWVVVQAGNLTIWPAAKIESHIPHGATGDLPANRRRTGGDGDSGPIV